MTQPMESAVAITISSPITSIKPVVKDPHHTKPKKENGKGGHEDEDEAPARHVLEEGVGTKLDIDA